MHNFINKVLVHPKMNQLITLMLLQPSAFFFFMEHKRRQIYDSEEPLVHASDITISGTHMSAPGRAIADVMISVTMTYISVSSSHKMIFWNLLFFL